MYALLFFFAILLALLSNISWYEPSSIHAGSFDGFVFFIKGSVTVCVTLQTVATLDGHRVAIAAVTRC